MPTYEYKCDACNNEWELEQRISEDPVKKCPKCGKLKARRMISGGNFLLKGEGWYKDLYHKPAAKKSSGGESGGSSSSGSSSDSGSSSSGSGSSGSSGSSGGGESKAAAKPAS
jgi:putative FmdB family regulatory protein